jgi:hypothetical protein
MENDIARATFIDIIQRQGYALIDDPWELEQVLARALPNHKPERSVLIAAAKERIPTDIRAATGGVPSTSLRANLAARLRDNRGITDDLARWAVDCWAAALGITPSGTHAALTPPVMRAAKPKPQEQAKPASDVWTALPNDRGPAQQKDDDWIDDAPAVNKAPVNNAARAPDWRVAKGDPAKLAAQINTLRIGVIVSGVVGVSWSILLKFMYPYFPAQPLITFALQAIIVSALLAWGIGRRSKIAAVILILVQLYNLTSAFKTQQAALILINIGFLVFFIWGTLAVFAYHAVTASNQVRPDGGNAV